MQRHDRSVDRLQTTHQRCWRGADFRAATCLAAKKSLTALSLAVALFLSASQPGQALPPESSLPSSNLPSASLRASAPASPQALPSESRLPDMPASVATQA